MAARFIDIAEFVFDEIDEILDLLPFRAVARGVKPYADRRICQIILHAAATRPDSEENPDIGGMGVIRVLCYDAPVAQLLSTQTLVDYRSDTAVTFGDMYDRVVGYNGPFRTFDAEVDFVASQVIGQGCKLRFRPRCPTSALVITTFTYHLQYFCLPPTGPQNNTKILDSITVEPDAQQEELRETVSEFGSSFVTRRSNVQSVADDPATLSMIDTSIELHPHWLELVYLDVPISLLLRGSPEWEEDGNNSELWDDYEA